MNFPVSNLAFRLSNELQRRWNIVYVSVIQLSAMQTDIHKSYVNTDTLNSRQPCAAIEIKQKL